MTVNVKIANAKNVIVNLARKIPAHAQNVIALNANVVSDQQDIW